MEWESRGRLWGQLAKGTLAAPVGGSAQERGEKDGAYGRASAGDQRIGMRATGRLAQGLRRAEAPSRQADATPQAELGVWVALEGRTSSLPQVAKQDRQC